MAGKPIGEHPVFCIYKDTPIYKIHDIYWTPCAQAYAPHRTLEDARSAIDRRIEKEV